MDSRFVNFSRMITLNVVVILFVCSTHTHDRSQNLEQPQLFAKPKQGLFIFCEGRPPPVHEDRRCSSLQNGTGHAETHTTMTDATQG